jgi:hypothetical protein
MCPYAELDDIIPLPVLFIADSGVLIMPNYSIWMFNLVVRFSLLFPYPQIHHVIFGDELAVWWDFSVCNSDCRDRSVPLH